ncbi:MAG: ABC transporter permease, partial [Maricaulaceae bacterium]
MLRHYLTAAFARFARSPFTTAANVLTLALGLACFIAAFGAATYWRSSDRYHENAARTFVIGQSVTPSSQTQLNAVRPYTAPAIAGLLGEDIAQIEGIARLFQTGRIPFAADDRTLLLNAAFAEPDFLRIFDFDFIEGDARHALDQPRSIILTQDAAQRLFGQGPALGQSILLEGDNPAVVTGVIAPVRQPSFMGAGLDVNVRFDALGGWDVHPGGAARDQRETWTSPSCLTFVLLEEGAGLGALNDRLAAFVERRMPPAQRSFATVQLAAFSVSEIPARGLSSVMFGGSGTGLTVVSALVGLGVLTLLIAGVNYANLATAQATRRGKEVGMRRALGAGWTSILVNAWLEAVIQAAISLVAALAILALAAPALQSTAQIDILFFLRGGSPFAAIVGLVGLVCVVALLASAYPAFVLSRVSVADALRAGRARGGSSMMTRVLVGVQFMAASFLLIMVTVTQLQRAHLEATALQPHHDSIVMLNNVQRLGVGYDALAQDLAQRPGVASVTGTDHPPWDPGATVLPVVRSPEEAARETPAFFKRVAHDYFSTLNLDVLAGRAFDREREVAAVTDLTAAAPLVVDWSFARALGFTSPQAAVGQTVFLPESFMAQLGGSAARPMTIIGVVETDVMRLGSVGTDDVAGHIYQFTPEAIGDNGFYPLVRLDPEQLALGLDQLEAAWRAAAPNTPLEYRFYDDMFAQTFRHYARTNQLFITLAGAEFAIASLGLFGIAAHVAGRRRHEIGV